MRQRKLYHPLWTHLPAVALLGYIISRFVVARPLPASVPVHFGFSGRPDRLGSPWELIIAFVAACVFWLAIAVLGDELWARQENRKTFNWLSLLDEGIIAGVAALITQYGDFRQPLVTAPGWPIVLSWVAVAVAIAAALEYLRPYVPHESSYQPEDTSRLETEIGSFVEEGRPWVYWESQNPAWMNWIIAATVASLLFGAYQALGEVRPAAIVLGLLGLLVVFLYGGLRVMVAPDRMQVRLGIFGIPLLRLRLTDIASVSVHEFSPLREFGGYGIRFNRQMKAYFFRGNRGVLIEAASGKKYLVGSDHPERLAAVLDVARRMAGC